MAFASSVIWEANPSGATDNGGGFDPVSGTPGTDYSQATTPQVTYADLVIDAVTNTDCTSAGNPFTSSHVGNVINITSGTGFTVQRVQIMSVTSGVARMEKSLGTLGSTGGNGKLGGCLSTIQACVTLMVPGNTCYIKGTHTVTATISVTLVGTTELPCRFVGYATNRNLTNTDTKPIITTATNSTVIITGNASECVYWRNLQFTNSAATKAAAITNVTSISGGTVAWQFIRCKFGDASGGNNLLNAQTASSSATSVTAQYRECEIAYCTGAGWTSSVSLVADFSSCYIHHNALEGINHVAASGTVNCRGCIITDNTGRGIHMGRAASPLHRLVLENSTLANNGTAQLAFALTSGTERETIIRNNIFYGAGAGTNINMVTASKDAGFLMFNNAFGGSGAFSNTNCTTGEGAITLSGDPFTNAASGDYSLNNTAGAGAACRGVGVPTTFPGGLTTNTLDIGAAQHAEAGGGGTRAYGSVS